ncbi:hypothetical protein PAMP_024318 [Pampus punctatissimus]
MGKCSAEGGQKRRSRDVGLRRDRTAREASRAEGAEPARRIITSLTSLGLVHTDYGWMTDGVKPQTARFDRLPWFSYHSADAVPIEEAFMSVFFECRKTGPFFLSPAQLPVFSSGD